MAAKNDQHIEKADDDSESKMKHSGSPEKQEEDIEKKAAKWLEEAKNRTPIIVTAGKIGVGKSTMINNFLDLKGKDICPTGDQPKSTTTTVRTLENKIYNIKIKLVDTPGLGDFEKSTDSVLEDLSETIHEGADVLLYCASMQTSARPNAADVEIIKSFSKFYGSNIWKHTILVLTFANNRSDKNEKEYKELIESYATRFQEILKIAKVKNVDVQSIFSENDSQKENGNIVIPAVPIGYTPIEESLKCGQNWSDLLLQEIINHCDTAVAIQLLKWKGLLSSKSVVAAAELTGGIMGGAALGAALGTAIGAPFAGFGAIPGAIAGASAGAATGVGICAARSIVSRLRRTQADKKQSTQSKKLEESTVEDDETLEQIDPEKDSTEIVNQEETADTKRQITAAVEKRQEEEGGKNREERISEGKNTGKDNQCTMID